MKKNLSFLVLLLGLVFVSPLTNSNAIASSNGFLDMSESHENFDAIEYVKNQNIVNGYEDGTYRPDQTINRSEFTKIIIGSKYSNSEIESCKINQPFNDIDVFNATWVYQYSCVARNENIINGYLDGSFKPYDEISFIEASKIISNTFGYDISPNDIWYKPYVEKLSEKKAIPVSIDSLNKSITRGEMAEMIYRLKSNVINKVTKSYEELINDHQDISDGMVVNEGQKLDFETVLYVPKSNLTAKQNRVIKSVSQWNDIWPNTDLPEIDFDNEMMIVVFQGIFPTGGYSIKVNRIIENDNGIEVLIEENSPGRECILTQAITYPQHIVKLKKTDNEVLFKSESKIISCSE